MGRKVHSSIEKVFREDKTYKYASQSNKQERGDISTRTARRAELEYATCSDSSDQECTFTTDVKMSDAANNTSNGSKLATL